MIPLKSLQLHSWQKICVTHKKDEDKDDDDDDDDDDDGDDDYGGGGGGGDDGGTFGDCSESQRGEFGAG